MTGSSPKALRQRTIDMNHKGMADTKAIFDALTPHRVGFVKVASPLWEKQDSGQWAVVDCICPPSSQTRIDQTDGSCASIGKHPLGKGWETTATTDWDIAKSWLDFGFSLGMYPLPGCRVIGLDEDREDALATLFDSVGETLPIGDTMCDVMRGRYHLFLLAPEGYDISELTTGTFDGGDVFRDGLVRQFVAPNMLHPAGRRRWNNETALLVATPAFLDALAKASRAKKERIEAARAPSDPDWEVKEGDRHAFLLSSAARLRNLGLGEVGIAAGLGELNALRCKPPKTDAEIKKIARDYATKDVSDPGAGVTLDLKPGKKAGKGGLVIRDMDSYTAKPVRWLWNGWMPRAEPVILEGLGGEGKSTFVVDVIARLTRGDRMPDGEPNAFGKPVNAIYITGEDQPEEVLRPRFIGARADTSRIHFVASEFTVPDDLQDLADKIMARPDVRLVFIDPIFSHVAANLNTGSDSEVRKKVMNPLRELAHGLDVTVLIARHLNKKGGDDPILRGSGTYGGLTGAARSVIQSISDPASEDKERKIVGVIKANYGRIGRPWVYDLVGITITDGVLGEPIETTRIEWRYQHAKYIDQIVLDGRVAAATKGASRHEVARNQADEDLGDILGSGAVERGAVMAEMTRRGHSRDGTYGARDRLSVVITRPGKNTGPYYWSLPVTTTEASPTLFN